MRTLFFILFFVLGFCYIQARGQKPAHVIITAGQSNTDGRVPNNRLPDYIKAMAVDSTYTAEPTNIAILPIIVQMVCLFHFGH